MDDILPKSGNSPPPSLNKASYILNHRFKFYRQQCSSIVTNCRVISPSQKPNFIHINRTKKSKISNNYHDNIPYSHEFTFCIFFFYKKLSRPNWLNVPLTNGTALGMGNAENYRHQQKLCHTQMRR